MGHNNKKIQLDDIAKELGISKSTVSRAISGNGRISESTRMKVAEYIKQYNYRPNVIARSLAQSKTFNIGVVLPADKELSEIPFFQTCLLGVCEQAASKDYDVVVTTSTQEDISLIKRLIENNKVDGIIITRSVLNDPAIQYLKENSVPFVVIGSCEDDSVIQIDTDHESACCELTSFVLSQINATNVALITGSISHVVNRKRIEGFRKAFHQIGKMPDETLIVCDARSKASIENACYEILKKNPSCIMCGDDYICSILVNILTKEGLSVPGNIKVTSFYDSAFLKNSNPPITAIDIDAKEIGETAGRTLINLICGKNFSKRTLLGYELSIKKSTMQ